MFVPVLLGSESDKDFAAKITKHFDEFGIDYKVIVCSAHKVPEKLFALIQEYNKQEDIVYVTLAGRSNGLSGVTAGSSFHPVIACPPHSDKMDFMVNINSTLQMPSDTPVLTVLDPQNCALAVARIFALKDAALKIKIEERIKTVKAGF